MAFNEEMDKYAFLKYKKGNWDVTEDIEEDDYERALDIVYDIIEHNLTKKQRFCIKKYFFERYNTAEIAYLTGTSKANVSKHIRKAKAIIRTELLRLMMLSKKDYTTGK